MSQNNFKSGDSEISQDKMPKHVAIIMDGNGRWAQSKGQDRIFGHINGVQRLFDVVDRCSVLGISYLTLYCFSIENWRREEKEVSALMNLFRQVFADNVNDSEKNPIRANVKISAIGRRDLLPADVQDSLNDIEKRTEKNSGLNLVLALSYGSRQDILHSFKQIALSSESIEELVESLSEESISKSLSTGNIPDPDLLIRTSGEFRISNFLLWEIAYSEIIVCKEHWPDFSVEVFNSCLEQFSQRERRFGMTSKQIQDQISKC